MPNAPAPNAPAQTAGVVKAAVVTGGGGGLGRSVALLLARRGWSVAIVDVDAGAAEEVARSCREAGGQAVAITADLGSADGPAAMVDRAVEAFGRIDVLVNNAGFGTCEAFLDMTAAAWDKTLDVNLRGVALATAAAGRHMAKRRSGRIINITSPASRMALPNYAAYAASKAGVDSVTRAAAVALAPLGVVVNSVAPGMMDTPLQRSTEAMLARLEGRADMEAFLAERTRRIPLGRRAECDEVAAAVVWLAADAPDYVTAERLNVSGGLDKD
jgi:NAD(P)-dependent dehydrogenase (short-subunit alcohol dehydrogenase family)